MASGAHFIHPNHLGQQKETVMMRKLLVAIRLCCVFRQVFGLILEWSRV